MSITRRIFFGAAASWFSRGLTILLGLVLMPVLFRMLGKEELGLWLLLGQSAAVLGILDFGFGVTLTRRLAFAKGKSGSDPAAVLGEASRADIADLVSTGLRIYRVLALVTFVVSFGLGFLYLRSLDLDQISLTTVWIAWAVLCLSQALTVWATPWTCLLQGVGHVGWDALIASFTGAVTLIAQIVVALCGGGILALAITAAAGALLQRFTILLFARRKQPDLFALRGRWRGDLFKEMAPLAWHAWLTALGGVIIFNSDQFFITKMLGPEDLPSYRAAYIILLNFNILAVTLSGASTPFIAHLWRSSDLAGISNIVMRNLRYGLVAMAIGSGIITAMENQFFHLWLGPDVSVDPLLLFVFSILLTLDAQSTILSNASRATEDEAFAVSTMTSAFIKATLSVLLIKSYGVVGVAAASLVAQLTTNHWYMVYRALKRLEISFQLLATHVIAPTIVAFVASYAANRLVKALLSDQTAAVAVIAGILVTALGVLAVAFTLYGKDLKRFYEAIIMNQARGRENDV